MIKCETIGQINASVNNPVIISENAVDNYTFLTDNGIVYLIANTVSGDDSYVDEITFAAGEYLNGFNVAAWVDQKLVIDERHIAYGTGEDFDDITAGTTLLTIDENGALAIADSAPDSGVYFKVTDKMAGIGGNRVKALVMVA